MRRRRSPETRGFTSLNGFGPLPDRWEIDWNLFFCAHDMPTEMEATGPDTGTLGVKPQTSDQRTQPGYRIDTQLVDPLAMLPPDVAKSGNEPDGIPSLAYRNLLRGSAFALSSGQNVARALKLKPLTEDQLRNDTKGGARGPTSATPSSIPSPTVRRSGTRSSRRRNSRARPVSRTARGAPPRPVGGRIVAEVLVGLVLNDHASFLYQDLAWTPHTEAARSGFDAKAPLTNMFELVNWTTGGSMSLA